MKKPFTIIKKKELTNAEVMFRSDGIVHFYIKANITLNGNDAREMVKATGEIGGNKKYPILITSGKYGMADVDAREYAASLDGNKYTIAGAIVVKSLAQKILGNAYIKVNKPTTPTALFNDEEKAIDWLKTFMK